MRRRRSDATLPRLVPLLAAGLFLAAAAPSRVEGQDGGAIFLLIPVGARAVGQGQAVVASTPGTEGLWWNPASLAWATERDFSLAASRTIIATGLAVNVVVPAGRAGVLAAGLYALDYGEQEATDPFGPTGRLLPRSIVAAGSYSATFGKNVAAGLTYKFVQQRFDCDGSCGSAATGAVSTSAFDFGAQVFAGAERRLAFGAALRNLGFALQVNDSEQADPLPTRVHLGAQYRLGAVERQVPGGELIVSAELVDRPSFGDLHVRGGAELSLRKTFFVRGGFVDGSADASGAAVGLGVRRGGIVVDFARAFGGFSSDAGTPPTYVTLSFRF